MARSHLTPRLAEAEDAVTALFCLVEDAYRLLDPREARSYGPLRSLSNSEIFTLALFQQLRGVESERSFLREAERFFAHLFPGVLGLWPSSFNRRVRGLRRFLEPLRRFVLPELVGDPETPIVDSTLLAVLHPGRSPSHPASRGRRGPGGAPSPFMGSSCTCCARPTACPLDGRSDAGPVHRQ